MKLRSSILFVVIFSALSIVIPAGPFTAAATESPDMKTGQPATKAEWDKLVADAQKEGKVVIFAGPIGDAREALTTAFRQKYGISLEILLGRGEEIVTKVTAERRAGIYSVDLMLHGMTTFFNSVKPKALTVPIAPLLVAPDVLDRSKWRGGRLPFADKEGHLAVLVYGSAPHLLVNTTLVKPGEFKTHQDFLDPKWRSKLVINDPSVGGAGAEWFTFVMLQLMGQEKGMAFMKQLVKQEQAITRNQRLLAEWVARGKYVGAIGTSKATAADLMRSGAPVAYADMKDPRPTSSGTGNIMVVDKAPHPNATKLFTNWILSKDGAAIYSKAHGYASTRLDVSTEGLDPMLIPTAEEVILGEEYQKSKGKMRKLAAQIFGDLKK
ncbi:MAG: extracellular solute-binding protein [Desulfobacterales bacterium]|nr:extracellular solute-binding protein [Desulfobacterales bacterium]